MRLIDARAYRKELETEKTCCERSEDFLMGIEVAIADLSDMPTIDGLEKVTYCKDCQRSYTPVCVFNGDVTPVITARFCGLTNRLVKDYGYCDEGQPKDVI